jgi:hypothetical protein
MAAFYLRLVATSKPNKVTLVACMRKLLTILNAIANPEAYEVHPVTSVAKQAIHRVDGRSTPLSIGTVPNDDLTLFRGSIPKWRRYQTNGQTTDSATSEPVGGLRKTRVGLCGAARRAGHI